MTALRTPSEACRRLIFRDETICLVTCAQTPGSALKSMSACRCFSVQKFDIRMRNNWDPASSAQWVHDENDSKHLARVDRNPGNHIFVLKHLLQHLDGGEIPLGSEILFSYRKATPDLEFLHDDQYSRVKTFSSRDSFLENEHKTFVD